MPTKNPQEKADYLMDLFGNINQCIKVCDDMQLLPITKDRKEYYQQVKEILINKK